MTNSSEKPMSETNNRKKAKSCVIYDDEEGFYFNATIEKVEAALNEKDSEVNALRQLKTSWAEAATKAREETKEKDAEIERLRKKKAEDRIDFSGLHDRIFSLKAEIKNLKADSEGLVEILEKATCDCVGQFPIQKHDKDCIGIMSRKILAHWWEKHPKGG